jgi:hypothetical protein
LISKRSTLHYQRSVTINSICVLLFVGIVSILRLQMKPRPSADFDVKAIPTLASNKADQIRRSFNLGAFVQLALLVGFLAGKTQNSAPRVP